LDRAVDLAGLTASFRAHINMGSSHRTSYDFAQTSLLLWRKTVLFTK